jgi:hypothetical protein
MGLFAKRRTIYGEGYSGPPIRAKDIMRAKKMFKTNGTVTVAQIEAARKPLSGIALLRALLSSDGRARAKGEHAASMKAIQDEAVKHAHDGGSYGS